MLQRQGREEGLGAVSGSRLCCSTRAGRWEAFCWSTTAQLPCFPSLDHQQLCSLQGTPCTGTQGCPWCLQKAKYMLGECRVVLLLPLKKGCVRFNERNEWAPARLPACSPLLESQLDSVPLLNKYLLNLLLTMFRLIRAGIAVEILYEHSTSCWLILHFIHLGEWNTFSVYTRLFHIPWAALLFLYPMLDLVRAKAAAADCRFVLMLICLIFFFNHMKTFLSLQPARI